MKYLAHPADDPRKVLAGIDRYCAYLESVRHGLPAEVFELASPSWRFDFTDHRCLHDSWVEKVSIDERSSQRSTERRSVEITIRLLGAFHDGYTTLRYEGVTAYQIFLNRMPNDGRPAAPVAGHGDWMVDELRLDDAGAVVHEILLSNADTWQITCEMVRYSTTIPGPSASS